MVSIPDLTIGLVKTIKAAQIYQTIHPTFKSFFRQFFLDLTEYLKINYHLILQIERFALRHENTTIYEETEKDISIAFRLFKDGIREIKFTEGLTEDELLMFIEIISRAERDQDIALNLWECDFSHINFYVVEEEEEEKLAYTLPELPKLDINYDAAINEILAREKIDFQDRIPVEINPDELRILKNAIAEIENQTDFEIVTKVLLDVYKNIKTQEVVEALAEILEICLNTQDFKNANMIVNYLWNYADINLVTQIENEELVMGFAGIPDILDEQSFSDFIALVGFFSKKAVPWFIKILKNIANEERLRTLQARLAYICQGDIEPVMPFLKERDIKTLANAIVILGMIKNPGAKNHLKTLSLHPSPLVRSAIIEALSELEDAKAISTFLEDSDESVRIRALTALTKLNYPPIYSKLIKTIKHRKFFELNYTEQKAYFDCLVASGNNKLINDLASILFKWVLLNKKRYLIKRQLAARALAKIGNDRAIAVLKRGIKKRNEDIKAVCETALKFILTELKNV